MKELTIEQKAKLIEDKDEKIRKELIKYFKDIKQRLEKMKEYFTPSRYPLEDLQLCQDAIAWLEKQGEQKLADKVEPKFHEGEWVVYDHRPYQVVELPKEGYINLGLKRNGKTEFAPSTYCRHWTIQDAKDGDVLYSRHNTESFEWIGIFKSLDKENKRVFFHGFWHDMAKSFSVCRNEAYVLYDDFSPATKEQRDILFAKMKEADYEWDADKKELKKIEQEPVNYKKQLMDEMTECIGTYIQQKSVLSEEDDVMIRSITLDLELLKDRDGGEAGKAAYQKEIAWLKSLKDRIQPKVELTQLDKNILEATIAFVAQNNHFNCWRGVDKHTVLSAIHSLIHQMRWKPSDEQLEALEHSLGDYNIKIFEDRYKILKSLYNNLKKLKE